MRILYNAIIILMNWTSISCLLRFFAGLVGVRGIEEFEEGFDGSGSADEIASFRALDAAIDPSGVFQGAEVLGEVGLGDGDGLVGFSGAAGALRQDAEDFDAHGMSDGFEEFGLFFGRFGVHDGIPYTGF
jgi:hypothetical protein